MEHQHTTHNSKQEIKKEPHFQKQSHSHRQQDGNPPHGHAGHDHHAMMIDDFRKRFYVTLVLTAPVLLLSEMIQHCIGVDWKFSGSGYILFGLSAIIFFYGGWPFLKGWWDKMKRWKPGMMTLIGFAINVAFLYSAESERHRQSYFIW